MISKNPLIIDPVPPSIVIPKKTKDLQQIPNSRPTCVCGVERSCWQKEVVGRIWCWVCFQVCPLDPMQKGVPVGVLLFIHEVLFNSAERKSFKDVAVRVNLASICINMHSCSLQLSWLHRPTKRVVPNSHRYKLFLVHGGFDCLFLRNFGTQCIL